MSIPRKQFSIEVGGKTLTLETSSLAEQTNASVVAKYGETVVLVTVVMSHRDASTDYLPLKVDYEEKFYAAGKIIGSRFIRRETRPSEEAILAGRLVDRTIRPLFDQRIRREIQGVGTVLAYDEENDPEVVGLMAASTALGISDIPWGGPVAGVRVAQINGGLAVDPGNTDLRKPELVFETFVSGLAGHINMVEFSGKEAAEGEALKGFERAGQEIARLIDFQKTIIQEVGKEKAEVARIEPDPELTEAVRAFLSERLEPAMYVADKAEQHRRMTALRREFVPHLEERFGADSMRTKTGAAELLWDETVDELVHKNILLHDKRPDGRRLDQVRELKGEVGLFSRTHGSALFVRGNTQALAVTTLAPPGAEQLIETMETTGKRRFLLHYNFPPYSVGEIGSFRGPGRREIGHGVLAEKGLRPLIPTTEEFPYTIRVVSEILSSNGSSSMATVCASSLSLMDAGVPIKKPAAGIAMGLMSDKSQMSNINGQRYKIITDIQGPEDHYGDMDCKVAGTQDGVCAIQMDVKIDGIASQILKEVLTQAKKARLEILEAMNKSIDKPRPQISSFAPVIMSVEINPEQIGEVIGPGGKMIKKITKDTGVDAIDIEESGRIFVASIDREKAQMAIDYIKSITREFQIGEIIEGEVIKILDFGAIVDLGGGRDGMIHVSELKQGYVEKVQDVVKIGDKVRAKIVKVENGKIGLSLKAIKE